MSESGRADDPRTLVMGYNGSFSTFTVSPLNIRPRAGVTRWVYSSLLRFDEDLQLRGDLARDYDVSADGRTYTFRLRPDAWWHDGEPVTADDIIFTAQLLQQPQRYFRNTLLVDGEPISFKKVNDLTLQIELPRRFTPLPAYLTPIWGSLFLIVPEHLLRDGDEEAFERHPIGSGPFRFGEIAENGDLTLLANELYFGGRPGVDRVLVRFFAKLEERREAFARGEVDVLIGPGRTYTGEEARRHGGRVYVTRTNTTVQFVMNCRHPLFQSARVRQAIAYAVDRERMVRDIEGPDGLPAWTPVGPISWAYEPDVKKYPHDPERARQLLAEEGWQPGEDGILRRDGQPFRFAAIFQPETWNYALEEYATQIKRYLREVGIDLEVRPTEYWSGMKPAWRNQDFESFLYYDTFYVEPDLYWSWHSSMPKRPEGPGDAAGLPQYGYGVSGYANPTVDRLLEAYREEPDRGRQKELLSQAQKIMAEEVAALWLYNHPWRNVIHDRVQGLSRPSVADGTADLIVFLHPERLSKRAS